ncbi:MAG: chemotaxis protein CheW [Deltaproteobacteria bacterium]|nr:chemotaxis protein CheW [Deltaproteobacteria bacterium]
MTLEERLDEHPQYLTFEMLGETYALGILRVREIIEYSRITRVPRMPAFVRGVINLRGHVVPVLDLATKFGLEAAPVTSDTCIVILEVAAEDGKQIIGIVTDAVDEVIDLAPERIEPPPTFGTRIDTRFIVGMGVMEESFLLIIDIEQILSDDDLAAVVVAAESGDEALVASQEARP